MKKEAYAVITGASSGIGKQFAGLLAAKGYPLVLIARREQVLNRLADFLHAKYNVKCMVIRADLSQETEVKRCFERLKDMEIELFINNAGLGEAGSFAETPLDKELFMVDVNVRCLHMFTKLMVQYFKERGTGYLLNVGSSAGLLPAGPYMAGYYACKAYVTSLTRAVAWELKEEGSDVYVGCLCPGPVDTEFNKVANVKFALKGISAKHCVAYAYRQMMKKQTVIVPTLRMKLAVWAPRLIPEKKTIAITAGQQKRKITQ